MIEENHKRTYGLMSTLKEFFLTFFMILIFFSPQGAVATTSNLEIGNLLLGFKKISYEIPDVKIMKEQLKLVNSFISDKKNADILKTKQGQLLFGESKKLSRYLKIKATFDHCLEQYKDKAKEIKYLGEQIAKNVGRVSDLTDFHCDWNEQQKRGEFDFGELEQAQKTTSPLLYGQMQDDLFHESLKSTANSAVHMTMGIQGALERNQNEDQIARSVLDKICPEDKYEKCKNLLGPTIKKNIEKLKKQKITPVSYDDLAKKLGKRVDRLNRKLHRLSRKAEVKARYLGLIGNKVKVTSKLQEEYEYYLHDLQNELAEDNGVLLLADKGNRYQPIRLDKDYKVITGPTGQQEARYKTHPIPNSLDIKASKDRILKEMQTLVDELLKAQEGKKNDHKTLNSSDTQYIENRVDHLKRIVMTGPVAVGNYLIKNPHMTASVCDLLVQGIQDRKSGRDTKDILLGAGKVVGGLLAGYAALKIGRSWLYKGVGSLPTTFLGNVLGKFSYQQLAFSLGGLMFYGAGVNSYYAYGERKRKNELERAFYAEIGDEQNIERAQNAFREYQRLVWKAQVMGLSGAVLAASGAAMKFGDKEKILRTITGPPISTTLQALEKNTLGRLFKGLFALPLLVINPILNGLKAFSDASRIVVVKLLSAINLGNPQMVKAVEHSFKTTAAPVGELAIKAEAARQKALIEQLNYLQSESVRRSLGQTLSVYETLGTGTTIATPITGLIASTDTERKERFEAVKKVKRELVEKQLKDEKKKIAKKLQGDFLIPKLDKGFVKKAYDINKKYNGNFALAFGKEIDLKEAYGLLGIKNVNISDQELHKQYEKTLLTYSEENVKAYLSKVKNLTISLEKNYHELFKVKLVMAVLARNYIVEEREKLKKKKRRRR